MRDPFDWLGDTARRRAFPPIAALAVLLMALFLALDGGLRTDAAPSGIVSFELARTPEAAGRIVASWDTPARVDAALVLGLDFLFLFAYATAIALACGGVARRLGARSPALAALGRALAWGQLGAGALDAAENVGLVMVLRGSDSAFWPALAWACAIPKFALVAAGLLYVAAAGPFALATDRAPSAPRPGTAGGGPGDRP